MLLINEKVYFNVHIMNEKKTNKFNTTGLKFIVIIFNEIPHSNRNLFD